MRKFLTALVVIPLGIFFIIFAVANRHLVTVSFDPFNSVTPTVAVTLPLFVVIIAVAMLGVLAGGMATWFRQGRFRRAAPPERGRGPPDAEPTGRFAHPDGPRAALSGASAGRYLRVRRARQAGRDVVEPAPSAAKIRYFRCPKEPCPCSSRFAACPRARRSTSRWRLAQTWWASCSFRRRRGTCRWNRRASLARQQRGAQQKWR